MLDVSDSARAALDRTAMSDLVDDLSRGDEIACIAFADGARTIVEPGDADAWLEVWATDPADRFPAGSASDLASGLARAAALARTARTAGRAVEIVVMSDARVTGNGEERLDAAARLRAAGCVELEVRIVASRSPPSAITALLGPGRVARGSAFTLLVEGRATEPSVLEIVSGGRVVGTRAVPAGAIRETVRLSAADEGFVAYEARLRGAVLIRAGSIRAGPIGASTHVVVTEPGSVLVVSTDGPRSELQRIASVPLEWIDPVASATLAARVAGQDALILDGVAAGSLSPAARSALRRAVRGGAGLLVLGGPDGFGAGGWAGDPLDDAGFFPLRARPPGDAGLLLYVALDGSGSMVDPWPGSSRSRDEVVRAAMRALVAQAGADTSLALRRFAHGLVPPGRRPTTITLDATGRRAAADGVDGLPAPSGGTALLPVFDEALRFTRDSGVARRHALVFTDGRTAETADELRAAASALLESGCGLTVVSPSDRGSETLRAALADTGARSIRVDDAAALAEAFRATAASARVDEPFVDGPSLFAEPGAEEQVPGFDVPSRAVRVNRVFAAPDARVLARTADSAPVAAVRREGLAWVAAIATRPGDAAFLPRDEATDALVRSLLGLVTRAHAGSARVERGRDGVLRVAASAEVVTARLETPDDEIVEVALLPGPGGVRRSSRHAVPRAATAVELLDVEGVVVATLGLDVPAPPELQDTPVVDLSPVQALAASGESGAGSTARPWLALLSIALLVLAHVDASRA